MSKEKADQVPDHVPEVHEANEAAGISEAHARQLDLALYEMSQGGAEGERVPQDPSAVTPQWPADIGTSSHARAKGSTSAKIVNHDRLFPILKNQFPGAESDEIEELIEYVVGTDINSIVREGYPPPDEERLAEVMAMDAVELEEFLYEDEEDEEEEDEDE